jgi:hypothetical protein
MSEDEQCGRWETTPNELKAEVKHLRAALIDALMTLAATDRSGPYPFVTVLRDRLQRALDESRMRTGTD